MVIPLGEAENVIYIVTGCSIPYLSYPTARVAATGIRRNRT